MSKLENSNGFNLSLNLRGTASDEAADHRVGCSTLGPITFIRGGRSCVATVRWPPPPLMPGINHRQPRLGRVTCPVLCHVLLSATTLTRNSQASPVHVLHNYPKNAIEFYFITAWVLRRHQFRAISSVLSCLSALYKCTLYNSRQHNYLNNLYSWLGIGADEQKASSLSTVNAFSGGLWLLSNASRRPNVSCRMSTATVLVKLRTSAWTRNVSCSLRLNS